MLGLSALSRAYWLLALTLLLLAGCRGADDGGADAASTGLTTSEQTLSGTVFYLERIALPADAQIEVRLEDVSLADAPAEILARQSIAADGRQVPIPFELHYAADRIQPSRRYAVRAEIRSAAGELMFTTTAHHAVLADGPSAEWIEILVQRVGASLDAADPDAWLSETGRAFVFECAEGVSFTVRTGPDAVTMWLPAELGGGSLVLEQTLAASGARYQQGDTVFWNRGELATIEWDGRSYVDCVSNPREAPWSDAAVRGAIFRAVGNEPFWHLEVHRDLLLMVTDLGETRTLVPHTGTDVDGAQTTYRAEDDEHWLTVVAESTACTDTMSGDAFETTVTVTFDDRTYSGCGRFL